MKKTTPILAVVLLAMMYFLLFAGQSKTEPVTFTQSGSIEIQTIDEKIKEAEVIVIGEVMSTLPSNWISPNGKNVKNATPEEIFEAGGLFTDTLFSVIQVLKGEFNDSEIRIRSFVGETEQVRWVDAMQVVYKQNQTYLLFLREDRGPTKVIDPGYYKSVNALWGVYEIVGDKATTSSEEWLLKDLIAYIENSLSTENSLEGSLTEATPAVTP